MLRPLPRRAGVHFRVEQVTGVGPTRSLNGAQFEAMKPNQTLDILISFVWRYKRLLGVGLFLGVLLTVFEVSGLRDHFNLTFMRQVILQRFCQLAVETRKKSRQVSRRADNRTGSLIRSRAADPQFHAIV